LVGLAVNVTLAPLQILVPWLEDIVTVGDDVVVILIIILLEVACVVDTQAELEVITTEIVSLLVNELLV
jgi:hypothetical protein